MPNTATQEGAKPDDVMPERVMIETRQLTKHYGDVVAVDSLDLTIGRGEVFGLLGPNGAGKTTTILMLLGLTEPSSGVALVDGTSPTKEPLRVKSRVGYLPDDVGFYDDMTARANLRYTASLNRLPRSIADDRIDALLVDVGLSDDGDRKVGDFSRGMRQRLGIADALVKDPSILILDEPTVNIDPQGVRELLDLVERLRTEQGVTVLLSSHLLHQVEQVCDRIGIFVRGRLVACGTIDDLAGDVDDRWVFAVGMRGIDDPQRLLAGISEVTAIRVRDHLWSVAAARDVRDDIQRAVLAEGGSLTHLGREGADLEAIYQRWFHGDHDEPAQEQAPQ